MTLLIVETSDLTHCHALRRAVFIEEQGVSEALEIDGTDAGCVHLLALRDGWPVGTARLSVAGETGHIGRVCVLADQRGTGLGAALMCDALVRLRALGVRTVDLGAQVHAIGFYETLGFVVDGPVYDDAGIPHRHMVRALDAC